MIVIKFRQNTAMNNTNLVLTYKFTNFANLEIVKVDNNQNTNFTNKWFADKEPIKANKFTK